MQPQPGEGPFVLRDAFQEVAHANILAMKSEKVGKGEVINIGSGKQYSVNQIAELIGGPNEHIAPRIEPKNTQANISKAKEFLAWEPSMSLEEGIKSLKDLIIRIKTKNDR